MNICSDLKHNAHSKAVLDDSWITVDTTSLHQHKLYYCDRSYLSHGESEQYKLPDFKAPSISEGFWPNFDQINISPIFGHFLHE